MTIEDRRVRVLREGHPSNDGRLIESGAVTWQSQVIPLMVMLGEEYNDHYGARTCGYVWDIRRETDGSGWLVARLHTTLNVEGLACEADLGGVKATPPGEYDPTPMTIHEARLAAVTLGSHPTWGDMTIGGDR